MFVCSGKDDLFWKDIINKLEKKMSIKLYVGNLPFTVTEKELKELFSPFGDIEEATIISDKYSGRSKGFGFVTFTDEEAGKKAISKMDGKDVQGREIKVNEARPLDPDRKPRRDFRRDRY